MRGSSSAMRMRVIRRPLVAARRRLRARAAGSCRRTASGKVDREGRAAAGGVGDDAVAAVRLGDRIDDREPEPRAADRALAVGAVEAAEDAVPGGGRDAGPVVAHPQVRVRRRRARCRSRWASPAGVYFAALSASCSHACSSRSSSPWMVPSPDASTLQSWPGMAATSSPTRAVRPATSIVDHRELRRPRRSASRSMSSTSRVMRSSSAMPMSRVLATSSASRGVHHLEVAADDRDGGLQLVPHVVQQLALHVDRALEPVEHRVDGAGEVGDVVVALRRGAGATGR